MSRYGMKLVPLWPLWRKGLRVFPFPEGKLMGFSGNSILILPSGNDREGSCRC